MLSKSIIAAVVLAVSAPAFAAGNDQLALALGLETGVYSTQQLVQIEEARRNNNADAERFILNQANGVSSRAANPGITGARSAGADQYALSLGVKPGTLSVNELIRYERALRDNDTDTQRFILNNAGRAETVRSDNAMSRAGKEQLARSLGVDADDYTSSELVALYSAVTND